MSLNDTNIKELVLSQFRGSDNTSDAYNVDPAHLLNAQNLDFTVAENGMVQAGTRTGTAVVPGSVPSHPVVSMANWLFVTGGVQTGYLAFMEPGSPNSSLVILSQNSGAFLVVQGFSGTFSGASFAIDGLRLYVAWQSSVIGGPGLPYAVVVNTPVATAPIETLFYSSYTISVSTTVNAANSGVVTQGTHRIGYVVTTVAGYTGVLNPVTSVSSNVWLPATFTTTDGTRSVTASVNFTGFNLTGKTCQFVMTTAANVNKVFTVPGASVALGINTNASVTISITDSDLAASGTDITQNQNLLAGTQNQGTSGPFFPSALFIYSSRLGYCTYDQSGIPVLYFSDQNNYQSLTAAFHGIYLEGRQIPIQGASLGGVCYIATLSGLYATQDNGGLPSTWIPPSRVDGSVGILSASCMSAASQLAGTATGRIILCAEKGLFIFKGGTFPEIPLSYWQTTDWNRINWAAPWQVQVVDDVYRQKIRVLAPLKSYVIGATNANPIVITTSAVQSSATGTPLAAPHLIPSNSSIAQVASTVSASGATTGTTAGINTTGATLLIITVSGGASISTAAVSDSNGNSWHPRLNEAGSSSENNGIWYAFDKSGSALVTGAGHTATVALANVGFTFSAFSGTLPGHVDPYDSTAGESGATTAAGTTIQPGSITPAAGSLVVTAFITGGTNSASSISTAFTLAGQAAGVSGTNFGSAMGFDIMSPFPVAVNPTWTNGALSTIGATIASFKAASSAQGIMQVTITGVTGNTAANGTFTPTILSPTTFSIPATGNGTYAGGGIVTPASQNAELTWTYPVGDEPGQPFYSLNSWAAYAPGAIAIVRNINTEIDETWYGPDTTSGGVFLRRVVPSDTNQYRDQDTSGNPAPINSILESVLIPGTADTNRQIHDYHGAHFRTNGSGSMNVTAFSLDHSLSVVPAASPLTLNLTPGQEFLMKWFLRNEQQSIQLSTNAIDAFFLISRIKAYYTDSLPMR